LAIIFYMDVCLNIRPERFLMKKRAFTIATASLLVLSFVIATFADVDKRRQVKRVAKVQKNPLVALLPASDAVATINAKRFFNEALPAVLSGNQKLLGEILSKIESVRTKTGVDLRRFNNVAAGINITRKEGGNFDFDPVLVARGSVDSAAAIEGGKQAAGAKYREETVNGKTIYIFSAQDIAASTQSDPNAAVASAYLKNEVAVAALDSSTVVVGSISRVRETLEKKTSISPELTALLAKKPVALLNFAGNIPGGLSALLPLDNDELGANLDSIKTVYGSGDVIADQAVVSVTGRTQQAKQAVDLKGTFEGLRDLGKGILGGSRAADKQLYARLLGGIRISTAGNEISLDLTIPKNDLDALLAIVSK
jgi:hypothetical protein